MSVDSDSDSEIRGRKTEAFLLGFGAITIPFGAVLGALLSGIGPKFLQGRADLDWLAALLLYSNMLVLFAFHLIVPVVCVAIVRRWAVGTPWKIGLALVVVLAIILLTTSEDVGIPKVMWLTISAAWTTSCLALAVLCRQMKISESFFR